MCGLKCVCFKCFWAYMWDETSLFCKICMKLGLNVIENPSSGSRSPLRVWKTPEIRSKIIEITMDSTFTTNSTLCFIYKSYTVPLHSHIQHYVGSLSLLVTLERFGRIYTVFCIEQQFDETWRLILYLTRNRFLWTKKIV